MKLQKIKIFILSLLCSCGINTVFAQDVTITVNANQDKRAVSPYIYGCNNSFDKPVQFYKDAGLRMSRANGGNNASAYNWRNRLSVHPDWYNNVYDNNWDKVAKNVNDNFPNMQAMFAFQLLGRAASSGQYNFDAWSFNKSQYWPGVGQNLDGGGIVDTTGISSGKGGNKALADGDINLFSKPWPADSSVAILDYWFGANGKGFNKNQFQYWSMDNEVDIWNGTHDWAMPTQISAEAFMDRYIELAKKAKAIYPGIKLCGPVTTSEWQWYKWSNESIYINGRYYPWIEYFIKRLGDEYKATGIKLVDVIDIHNYPYYNNDTEALQGHRIYYDETYDYPGSNGIKTSTGGWDNSLTKQYIFKRFNDWLNEDFGPNHGITAGVSEWSPGPSEPNLAAVIYASHLGTFANNGVEYFTPWCWFTGMWESLHLYSRYAKSTSVKTTSTLDTYVSGYSTITDAADSMTIILVNRDITNTHTTTVNISDFTVANGNYQTLQIASLPGTETFKSHTNNALKNGTASVVSNSLTVSLPPLSVTAILLRKYQRHPVTKIKISGTGGATTITQNGGSLQMSVAYTPANADTLDVTWSIHPSDTDSASISATGLLTAKRNSKVKVIAIAKDADHKTDTMEVVITGQVVEVQSVNITSGNTISANDGTLALTAAILPSDADTTGVTWSIVSADTDTASISGSTLTALRNGKVTIRATSLGNPAKYAEKEIIISKQVIEPTAIVVKGAGKANEITVNDGTLAMSVEVTPSDAVNTVTWSISSNDADTASISANGVLTAKLNGKVTVKAVSTLTNTVFGEKEITISGQTVKVTGITVTAAGNVTGISTLGGTLALSATVAPANATDNNVTWFSSDIAVATVATDGTVTAVADGTVTITATATDGSDITGTISLTISGQTSIDGVVAGKLEIFPNPPSKTLYIVNTKNIKKVEIINSIGLVIRVSELSLQNASVDVQSLSPGIYFIRAIAANSVYVNTFMIE